MNDPGDEDDAETHPKRWMRNGWWFTYGRPMIFFAAERIPSGPEHDPGDEEPKMRPLPGLMSYSDGI